MFCTITGTYRGNTPNFTTSVSQLDRQQDSEGKVDEEGSSIPGAGVTEK